MKRNYNLDIQKILVDLKNEKERLDRAIAALEQTDFQPKASKSKSVAKPLVSAKIQPASANQTGRRLTPEGRKRLSESMKKRWAERRKKG